MKEEGKQEIAEQAEPVSGTAEAPVREPVPPLTEEEKKKNILSMPMPDLVSEMSLLDWVQTKKVTIELINAARINIELNTEVLSICDKQIKQLS